MSIQPTQIQSTVVVTSTLTSMTLEHFAALPSCSPKSSGRQTKDQRWTQREQQGLAPVKDRISPLLACCSLL